MPNTLTNTGLTTASQAELVANYTAAFQSIYGANINLNPNSADGQMMNIFIQSMLDVENLITQVYTSMDADQAVGVILDARVSMNGIQRQAGTYSTTGVTLVTSQSVNLYGLDQTTQPVFTVADNAGNQWQLQTTQLGFSAPGVGTSTSFQSATPGANLTIPNTITVPVTIVLGVTSVNNPSVYTSLGINEESDAALRTRRRKSVSLASTGFYAGLLASLTNIPGVSYAYIGENTTSALNSDNVPGHSIWVVVGGTGAASAIANAIYTKRPAGCGMFGSTSFNVTQSDGSLFTVYWDTVVPQNLFVQFTVTSLNGTNAPNIAAILNSSTGLPSLFQPGVYAEVNINQLATLVQTIDPNTLVTNAGFATLQTQVISFSGQAATGSLILSYNGNQSASINASDTGAVIASKISAVPGLGAATFSGSFLAQNFTFAFPTGALVAGLISTSSVSLQTAGSASVTATNAPTYSPFLFPTSKKNQFVVTASNIVVTPIILSPNVATVVHLTTLQATPLGGYGPMTYVLSTNASGGSVSASGLYTAGSTVGVTDIVRVTDSLGNTATASYTVI